MATPDLGFRGEDTILGDLQDSTKPLLNPEMVNNYIFELEYNLKQIFGENVFDIQNDNSEEIGKILEAGIDGKDTSDLLKAYGTLLFCPTANHEESLQQKRRNIIDFSEPFILFAQLKEVEKGISPTTAKLSKIDVNELSVKLATIHRIIHQPKTPKIVKDLYQTLFTKIKTLNQG